MSMPPEEIEQIFQNPNPGDSIEGEDNGADELEDYYVKYAEEERETNALTKFLKDGNLASHIDDKTKTYNDIKKAYDEADTSMTDWRKKYRKAINLSKMMATENGHDEKEIQRKDFPFEGASLIMMPFILEAMIDFNSRSAPELAWADKIIGAKIYGENSESKEKRSDRVADFSNYQLDKLIKDWRKNQDKGLLNIAGTGTFYKKTYFDYESQNICSDLLMADQVIFNMDENKSFSLAKDKFLNCTYSRNDVISFIRGDQKWDLDEDDLEDDLNSSIDFIEAHTWIDLDEDGLTEPYVVIIHEDSQKIVSVYPNYDEDDIFTNEDNDIVKVESYDCFTQYQFLPDPEGGAMGMGWGILLGDMFDSINTTFRQLQDAGTLHLTSSNSGLISKQTASGRGNSTSSEPIEIAMGRLTQIETKGSGSLRDNVMQLPFSGPNPVLFQMLEYLVNSSRSMTNASVNVEASPGEAATLYLAKLQQGLKVPNSIFMRIHSCMKDEVEKIRRLNHRHYDDKKYNKVLDLDKEYSMEADFDPEDCDITLVSNPSQGSDFERIQRAQVVYEMAKDPQQPQQVISYRESVLGVLEAMGTLNIDKKAPEPDPNASNPQAEMQQAMIAQQMAEIEIQKKNSDIKQQEVELKKLKLTLDQQKAAMKAAKDMSEIGLKTDIQEAKISELYSKTLERIVKLGFNKEDVFGIAQEIEDTFIDNRQGNQIPDPQLSLVMQEPQEAPYGIPENNPGPDRNLAE